MKSNTEKSSPASMQGNAPVSFSPPTLYYGRILMGEITPILAGMKRNTSRWSTHQQDTENDPLIQQLRELQMTVTYLKADAQLEPNIFLDPFLAIIRSEDTTGPVTKSALAAVNRMLNYGLIDPKSANAVTAVEAVAEAVTHARFVGTDQGADEVVLWEILTVLRTLILGPVGHLLTNESVCEILNSSFRICFETRLSELLRNCTEDALRHMVQLLFSRLPQFKDVPEGPHGKLKMRAGGTVDGKAKKTKGKYLRPSPPPTPPPVPDKADVAVVKEQIDSVASESSPTIDETIVASDSDSESQLTVNSILPESFIPDDASVDSGIIETALPSPIEPLDISHTHLDPESPKAVELNEISLVDSNDKVIASNEPLVPETDLMKIDAENKEDFINLQGVKFTQEGVIKDNNTLLPFGLPCVREVFRFLISLTSPTNEQNTNNMINTALNLLTVALEVGAEHINCTPTLLMLVKDKLCRNLFLLITSDARPSIFMNALRVCTLLFDSLRTHLKFQLEMFINKLTSIVTSESINVSYSFKELALETIVQLWRMPGLITELFLNFDCNLYASNVFEDLTKVLSKNAFPVQGLYSTNLLSLEALLTVIETIDSHCPPKTRKKVKDLNPCSKASLSLPLTSTCGSLVVAPTSSGYLLGLGLLGGFSPVTPILKARTSVTYDDEISRKALLARKEKKKLLANGTDQFNVKPEKGIQFLQDNNIIGSNYEDIALFLKGNPHLDKKVIGEYVSKKRNVAILSAFVRSFDFRGLRIDQCLRLFLETFRLPGEAPVISIIIEHFSSHWHSSNGNPFNKEDAAFTLSYAVIMLNVDQHNQNAKKQNIPMTVEQFKNNLRGVNDGKDFDPKMLEDIYEAIHGEEIVMPAEQTGLVKENYLWKMLLRRGNTDEGRYMLSDQSNSFDRDLFTLCWGPTIASLSYVFDKSSEDLFVQKSIAGFKKCASIAARYGMSDVFDNLIVSLCKFTTLTTLSTTEPPEQIAVSFGSNRKAQLAAITVFKLVVCHGDILRDGWKNVLELLLQLFKCRLLSSTLIESEDFVEPSGKVSLVKEMPNFAPRVETGLLSSLYSYIALGDAGPSRGVTQEDAELINVAKGCIWNCHPEKLITESAFLRYDSLNELLKAMMGAGDANNMSGVSVSIKTRRLHDPESGLDEYSQAFLLELVVSVLVANKDRAGGVWPSIRDHIYSLMMSAAAAERHFLLERCIVAILKIAKVLLRRPELANPILQSLRMLLLLRAHVINRAAMQVVSGIFEILSVNADHIQDPSDWAILFALLECAGAGAKPPPIVNANSQEEELDEAVSENEGGLSSGIDSGQENLSSDVESSTTDLSVKSSVSDLTGEPNLTKPVRGPSPETIQNPGGWILVGREGEIEPVPVRAISVNEWDIVHQRPLGEHKTEALVKAVDTLSFLVREGLVTPASLPSVVQACRTFVEATLNGVKRPANKEALTSPSRRKVNHRKKEEKVIKRPKSPSVSPSAYDADESEPEDVPISYQQVSEKLLDLMDTLHTSSSQILSKMTEKGQTSGSISLWHQALCPLLQGIARYCCDVRSSIRNLAMTYLQRALLNHYLQCLVASEWESCFNKVLFPLLAKLLQPLGNTCDGDLEETRLRAATLVQKVYLRHLSPLLSLPTFTALWLTILDFMDKYLNVHKSDHLNDAIPEILKNMLLVMETTQVFHTSEGFTHLWTITWDRIDSFLPNFRHELFKSHPPSKIQRIEVVPSEAIESDTIVSETMSTEDLSLKYEDLSVKSEPGAVSPLEHQEAARLSLSQENLPTSLTNNFILQPPLPHLLPVSVSSSPPSTVADRKDSSVTEGHCSDSSFSHITFPNIVSPSIIPSREPLSPTNSPDYSSLLYSSQTEVQGSILLVPPYAVPLQETPTSGFTLTPASLPTLSPNDSSSTLKDTSLYYSPCSYPLTTNPSSLEIAPTAGVSIPISADASYKQEESVSEHLVSQTVISQQTNVPFRPASLLFSQCPVDDFLVSSTVGPQVACNNSSSTTTSSFDEIPVPD